jgi:hypothetical protein
MLKKTSISNVAMHSDDWFNKRMAKLTSSEWHHLMGEKGIVKGGESYIYRKVGEELTGLPCRNEISTAATEHGNMYENEGLIAFASKMNLDFLVTQKLITEEGSRMSSTPDALIVMNESVDKTMYNVSTVEVKCPLSYDAFISLWRCKTPERVRSVEPKYYWQVLHQMYVCDCLVGYLVIYHPFFKVGKLNVIEFRKINLQADFKLLNQRANEAIALFNTVRDEMMNS